jgi:hypothetical protein
MKFPHLIIKIVEYFKKHSAPEVSLWRAVIVQAVLDCLTQSTRKENINAREDALSWFHLKNKSFVFVCRMAMLEPSFVLKQVQKALKDHSWRRKCDIGKGMQFAEAFSQKDSA